MTPHELEPKLLWAAIEDWTGLWEPTWELQTLDPKLSRLEAEELVRSVIRSLLAKGWIRLFDRYTTGGDERGGDERSISPEEIERVLPGSTAHSGGREYIRSIAPEGLGRYPVG